MKALLLLSVLLLSAGSSKAAPDGMTRDEAYWYGSMVGVGNLLCIQVLEGDINIDTAKKIFAELGDTSKTTAKGWWIPPRYWFRFTEYK